MCVCVSVSVNACMICLGVGVCCCICCCSCSCICGCCCSCSCRFSVRCRMSHDRGVTAIMAALRGSRPGFDSRRSRAVLKSPTTNPSFTYRHHRVSSAIQTHTQWVDHVHNHVCKHVCTHTMMRRLCVDWGTTCALHTKPHRDTCEAVH